MVSRKKKILSFVITALGLLALFLFAVNTGSLKVTPLELFKGLFIEYNENVATIYDLRFPRILIAIFGGAATAVSGVLLQAVMKNPLADPGIIGVSSGASLTAVLITAFVPTLYFFTPLFAFIGGMVAFLLVYSLSWKGGLSPLRIILVGVAVNAFQIPRRKRRDVLFVSGLDGVLTLAVGDETGSYGLQLVLDDAAQSLTARLSMDYGAEQIDLLTVSYGTADGGAQLTATLDLTEQQGLLGTLAMHWAALETQPEALSDSPVGLFDLSEDELTALEKRIGAQIARLLYGEDMTTGETDAVLTGTWKMQVDLTPNLLDALNDALGLDLQMDDPTVMTMLVTFEEDGSYHMDYDAKALREELNALEDALCEKYPDQEALLKQAFAGLQLDVDGSSGTYTASNGILYLTQSGEDWEDILYYSVEDNKLYLTPPQDEESGEWGGMFGSEYPMVFERVD